ncbi:WGR domain-containing protein [Pedobacter sp. NJ-S-72]
MTRRFINQDNASNKFWNITAENKTQTITFGKVGTKGRELIKEFDSETECKTETQKLIGQKTKSGYVELSEDDDIPDKTELSEDEISELFFWESIKKVK